jgi:hypothetical protein
VSSETEEETTSNLRARDVGALATPRSFASIVGEECDGGTSGPARILSGNHSEQSDLKEGAAGALGE